MSVNKIDNSTRLDVVENHRLDSLIDWESWKYEDFLWIVHDFVLDIFIKKNKLKEIGASEEIVSKVIDYNNVLNKYLLGFIDSDTLNDEGSKADCLVDTLKGIDKKIIESIKTGLSDSTRSCFPEYDAGFLFGIMLSDFYKFEDGLIYKNFGQYIEQHEKTQIYKILNA